MTPPLYMTDGLSWHYDGSLWTVVSEWVHLVRSFIFEAPGPTLFCPAPTSHNARLITLWKRMNLDNWRSPDFMSWLYLFVGQIRKFFCFKVLLYLIFLCMMFWEHFYLFLIFRYFLFVCPLFVCFCCAQKLCISFAWCSGVLCVYLVFWIVLCCWGIFFVVW